MNIKRLFLFLAAITILSQVAEAVPRLRETAADFTSAIVTIYPDTEDSNLFYFLPNSASIAKDKSGQPLVSLTYTGLKTPGPNTLGYMTGVFEAGLTQPVQAELASFKSKHPGARLTVVPFGKSFLTFGVPVALDPPSSQLAQSQVPDPAPPGQDMAAVVGAQKPPTKNLIPEFGANLGGAPSALFSNLYLPPYAGVAETQVGFNAITSKLGTILMVAGMRGNNPMNMNLCYQVFGALPTMSAKITINYQRVYSYFQAAASNGWLFWGWSVAAAVEKLREHGDITITMTGADQHMEDYILKMAETLAARWMTPTLTAAPGASPNTGAGFSFSNFSVNGTEKEENKDVTYSLTEQVYVSDDRCMTLPMADLATFADKILINADGGSK
jgi:hypothetical protein